MNILLCVNRDIYCLLALNYLLPQLKNHQVKIYFSNGVGVLPTNQELGNLQKIERDLSPENISYLQVNKDFKEFLGITEIENNYQILDFKNINKDGFDFLSSSASLDLIISIRFGQIFKNPIIGVPKFGVINLHSGILPNYQGIMATFWAMLNEEKDIGTTLHFISDASIDTGDIIKISKLKINYEKPYRYNVLQLYKEGTSDIINTVRFLEKDEKINTTKQDQNLAKYFSYPDDYAVNKFLEKNSF